MLRLCLLATAVLAIIASPQCIRELTEESPKISLDKAGEYSAGDFNVISFGSITGNTGDVEGRALAANDCKFGEGWSVGDKLQVDSHPPIDRARKDSLVCGGEVTWGSGAVYPDGSGIPFPGAKEGIFAGSDFKGPEYLSDRVDGHCGGNENCINLEKARDYYRTVSRTWAKEKATVSATLEYESGLFLAGTGLRGRQIVNLDVKTFNKVTWWSATNLDVNDEYIINIHGGEEEEGQDIVFSGGEFPGLPEKVVFNILSKGKVFVSTRVQGSIIAPDATLEQSGGVIMAFAVFGSVDNVLQINKPTCGGCDCCSVCENEHPFF